MASRIETPPATVRQIQRIQLITIAWMSLETGVSLWAAARAKSPALFAFGADSSIELLSATIVLWRFRRHITDEIAEGRAARIAGFLLYAVAISVVAVSGLTLLGHNEPRPSFIGIAILIIAAAIMPWLGKKKRRLSFETGSAALRADAAESMLCAYLSIIALAGLLVSAFFRVPWADPVAALGIVPFIVWEARAALHGKACGCD